MKKRVISAFLAFFSVLALVGSSFASVRWDNAANINLTLAFNGSTAECTVDITGKSGVSKIEATVELLVKSSNGTYTRSASWPTKTVSGRIFTFTGYAYNRPAGDYRLAVTATVYDANGVGEDIYVYFDRTYNGSTSTTG